MRKGGTFAARIDSDTLKQSIQKIREEFGLRDYRGYDDILAERKERDLSYAHSSEMEITAADFRRIRQL